MVDYHPSRLITVDLTSKEKETVLSKCDIHGIIYNKILNSTGPIDFLIEDTYDLSSSIFLAIERTNNNEVKDILGAIFNKLTPNSISRSLAKKIFNKDFDSIDALNDHLQEVMTQRNTSPDFDMGGLSPEQVNRLIYSNWDDEKFPLKFNKELKLKDLKHSPFFNNTRLFLNTLLELSNEITATATGNLNRKIVKLIFDKMMVDDDDRDSILKYNKVINEDDVLPLHIIRIVCEQIGIIKKKSKKFYVVKKYQSFLSDSKAGELFYLLFYNYFRKFNLGYLDRLTELECIQNTLGYSLYRLGEECNNYQKIEKLPKKVFLPAVREEIDKNPLLQRFPSWVLTSRIIEPLEEFGLLECQYKKDDLHSEVVKVRKSKLFDKFIVVRW